MMVVRDLPIVILCGLSIVGVCALPIVVMCGLSIVTMRALSIILVCGLPITVVRDPCLCVCARARTCHECHKTCV